MSAPATAPIDSRDLVISRVLCAPRAALWQAWSEPALLAQWWCPKPWCTEVVAFELRPGGTFHSTMRGPDGGLSDNPGSFLEVVPHSRLVFSSLLTAGWRPAKPWLGFTAVIGMEDDPAGCRYTTHVHSPGPGGARAARAARLLRRLEHGDHPARGVRCRAGLKASAAWPMRVFVSDPVT